jgi:hypothetical protein
MGMNGSCGFMIKVAGLASTLVVLATHSGVQAAPVLAGSFEPDDTPTTVTPFGFSGASSGKCLRGGSADPSLGNVPAATQGSHVFGMSWTEPGAGNTLEVKCEFAAGYTLAGVEKMLLDVYVPAGTDPGISLGVYFTGQKTWVPETTPVGANGSWITMQVAIPGLSGDRQRELNLGFKKVKGSGRIFFDNLRFVSGGGVVAADPAPESSGGATLGDAIRETQVGQAGAGLNWFGDLAAAQQVSAQSGKKILLFFDSPATDASVYQKQVFADPRVLSAVGSNYVLVKLTLEDHVSLAGKLGVFKAGTIGVFKSDGSRLALIPNRVTPDALVSTLAGF